MLSRKRCLLLFLTIVGGISLIGACASQSIEDLTYYEPGSEVPRLNEEGKSRVKEIALNDSRVRELIAGKKYAVAQEYREYEYGPADRIGIWHTSEDLRVIGAVLDICFDKPYTIQYDWFMPQYNEDYEYCGESTMPPEESQVLKLTVYVDFTERKVVGIQPLPF